jgi:5-methylthioadenosine/S-adenosylhomocysteine deaminase
MRTAALLKAVGDAEACRRASPPRRRRARGALGLDAAIGSIAPGKFADLCAVALEPPGSHCATTHIAPRVLGGRENVTDVWAAGRARSESGLLWNLTTSEQAHLFLW